MILLTGCLLVSRASGQQPLSYQVLLAEKASFNNQVVSQFDHLWPGDTVHIESSGYLALISSNFHSIEIAQDSVLVLPDLGTEDFGKDYSRPDLRGLFATQNIGRSDSYGAVEHAPSSLKLVYPTIRYSLSSVSIHSIPILWYDIDKKVKPTLAIKSMFDEDIIEVEIGGESICLNLEDYPTAMEVLAKDKFLMVEIIRDSRRERSFAIKLSDSPTWHPPFDVCEINTPVMAVAFAMFLEYNRKNLNDPAKPYYLLATQLSSLPLYKRIYEHSVARNK